MHEVSDHQRCGPVLGLYCALVKEEQHQGSSDQRVKEEKGYAIIQL